MEGNTFIYYNYLPSLAPHVIDLPMSFYSSHGIKPKHNYPDFKVWNVKQNDCIFVKTDLLHQFFERIYNSIHCQFYLITGSSDYPIGIKYLGVLNHGKIIKWFGQNMTLSHKRAVKVPIGFDENESTANGTADGEGGDQMLLEKLHSKKKCFEDKANGLLITYASDTHQSRRNINKIFANASLARFIPKMGFENYMSEINEHRYVLCPRGNGVDTHRFWETLLMGSVPVVERSGLSDLYEKFPCIIVKSFSDLREIESMIANFSYDVEKANNIQKYLRLDTFNVFFADETNGA